MLKIRYYYWGMHNILDLVPQSNDTVRLVDKVKRLRRT